MKERDSRGRFIKKNSEKAEKKSKKGRPSAKPPFHGWGRRRDRKGRFM